MMPVLLVEEIEPCLGVWEQLGFERTMEMPEGDRSLFMQAADDESDE